MTYKISKLRKFALSIKNSALARELKSYPGAFSFAADVRSGKRLLLDVDSRIGMGAILSYALRLQAWADRLNIPVRISSTSPLYSNGEDIFVRFFENDIVSESETVVGRYAKEWIYRKEMPQHIDLDQATQIFHRLFRPKTELTDELDKIADGRSFDLSIHMRSTDKVLDSGVVPINLMFDKAAEFLDNSQRVFLATDSSEFRKAIVKEWPNIDFLSYDLGAVADGVPRHFSSIDAGLKAKEAIANIYLISRAPVCVRTSSFMSSFSKIVNPALKTITINRTILKNTPFPELQILSGERRRQ